MDDTIGHNSTVNAQHLRQFIERIERMHEEKQAIADDIKEIYAEAKGNGFDPKIIRQIVQERKMDPDKREEERALRDLYLRALSRWEDTPLGQSDMNLEANDA